jgi:hypothetical protein
MGSATRRAQALASASRCAITRFAPFGGTVPHSIEVRPPMRGKVEGVVQVERDAARALEPATV